MNTELRNIIDSMTEEQKALAKKCKTPEEFMKLAQSEMIELSDEQLAIVAGGEKNGMIHATIIYAEERYERHIAESRYMRRIMRS